MIKRLKKGTKILVRCNGISFYTTPGQIRESVGNMCDFNAAVQKALDCLEFQRMTEQFRMGVGGTWEGIQLQLDIM